MKVAALYVEKGGVYYGLPDGDQWDKERDARLYAGPYPVVAHPPCGREAVLGALIAWNRNRFERIARETCCPYPPA